MDIAENSFMRRSQIRPPSRIPSPGKPLSEVSESEGNVRVKPVSQLPVAGSKQNFGASAVKLLNDAEPKRKTLAERAGEPVQCSIVAPTPRPTMKGTSLVGARSGSYVSTTSTRTAHSRSASNNGFASSVGHGARPKSSYGQRPQNSLVYQQSTTGRPVTSMSSKRPASSMDDDSEDSSLGPDGKRKGRALYSLVSLRTTGRQSCPAIRNPKLRSSRSQHTLHTLPEGESLRQVSVTTAMSRLHLDDHDSAFSTTESQGGSIPSSDSSSSSAATSHVVLGRSTVSKSSSLVPFQDREATKTPPKTPSHIPIPILIRAEAPSATPTTPSRFSKNTLPITPFLTKGSNVPAFSAWDVRGRLEDVEAMYATLKDTVAGTTLERNGLEEAVSRYKVRIVDLESAKLQLESKANSLHADLDMTRQRLTSTTNALDDDRRSHRNEVDEQARELRKETDKVRREMMEENEQLMRDHHAKLRDCRHEMDQLRRELSEELERNARSHRETLQESERRKEAELEDERCARLQEVQNIRTQVALDQQNLDMTVGIKEKELQNLRGQLEALQGDFDREQTLKAGLQRTLDDSMTTNTGLRVEIQKLDAHIEFLKSDVKGQSDKFVDLERELEEARTSERSAWQAQEEIKSRLVKEETMRRILFNQVQELKGNIRVMCRVRPSAISEADVATIAYPDLDKEAKELEIQGPEEKSSLGTISRKNNVFSFDRVFGPSSQNEDVFEEISQLVQSALDGYNVCIFCYGQTGAGKTHTMSSPDGMIPRATHQIYDSATKLKEKGWTYSMEGTFVEVYNEEIHDLLGNPKEFDKKKHEIKHDDTKKQTTVTGLKTVPLESEDTVENILKQAASNRSVAATKSNERSSRSHSVFILKLIGKNSSTGETSEGTLNLVDLAGSERLKSSGAEGVQMKETQNINKSLSCLGDVIGALGQGKEGTHIPYRNSKLTYLLQYSLGGNSKTLMFVMISPLETHLRETLTSLKFATKVHNTHIGTAKKTTKTRD